MKTPKYYVSLCLILIVSVQLFSQNRTFEHPGLLVTSGSVERMKTKVNANVEPWLSGWNKLTANSHAQLSYTPNPVVKLIRGGNSTEEPEPDNYSRAFNDAAAAFQCAVRWKVSGDDAYAEKSIEILNAWASTCTSLSGNSNIVLGAGIYGYQFANAAEIMRDYQGWNSSEFAAFKQWLVDLFLPISKDFLVRHNGTCDGHYWANWDLVSLSNVIAIAVLTDSETDYDIAIDYLKTGVGNGNINKAIYFIHSGDLGQMQESGRDQGHTLLCVGLLGEIAQVAWNQGDDLFAYDDNRILKGAEYASKYNVAMLSVPFEEYTRYDDDPWGGCTTTDVHTQNGTGGRGGVRPIWALLYAHYNRKMGLTTEYVKYAVENLAVEGGGGDYGSNSGGYDSLGFGTLLYTQEDEPDTKDVFEFDDPNLSNYWVGLHSSTNVIEDGKLKVTFSQTSGNRRADLKYIEGGTFPANTPTGKWKYSSEYPILAYKIKFNGTGLPIPGTGNIILDRFDGLNNSYKKDFVSENVIYYDVSEQFGSDRELISWQLKIADISSGETGYEVDWIKTFKNVEALKDHLGVHYTSFENSNVSNYWVGTHSSTNVIEDGKLKVTFSQTSGNRRADLKYVEGGTFPANTPTGKWKYSSEYPILAYKITFNGTGLPTPGTGNIILDRFDGLNNSYKNDFLSDNVIYYDVSEQFGSHREFVSWMLKIADISSGETGYEVHWVKTFSSVSSLQTFINSGLSSKVLKLENSSNSKTPLYMGEFKLYPNPSANNKFYIKLSENSQRESRMLKVYNILGSLVLQKKLDSSDEIIELNHNLTSGFYIVKINEKTHNLVVK